MEYEQIASGLSVSTLDLVDHDNFDDPLNCNDEYIDNSNDDTLVFGLSW